MTNNQAIGLGLLAASFWYFVLRGASALRIGLNRVRIAGIAGDSATLEVELSVFNPLLAQVLIRSVQGTISIMGKPVGVINYPINRRLAARSTTLIPVQVMISYQGLGDAVWQSIMSGSIQTLAIELQGSITAGEKMAITVPVRKMWTYSDIIQRDAQ